MAPIDLRAQILSLADRATSLVGRYVRSDRHILVQVAILLGSLAVVAPTAALVSNKAAAGVVQIYLPFVLNNCNAVPSPSPGWTLLWSDDFAGVAGSAPSPANWLYDTGTAYPGGPAAWGTGEVETDTTSPANIQLDGNGHLVITPIESAGAWTSGRIESRRSDFAAPAGGQLQVTVCLQQPHPANGLGYWPAFWMLGAAYRGNYWNWPGIGEVDIMEDANALSQHSGTFHCGTDPGGPCNEPIGLGSGLHACTSCQSGYHNYSVVVDRTNVNAEQIRYYLDGNEYYSVSESQVGTVTWQAAVHHGFFLILDLAVGGGYPDGVCRCSTPTQATSSGAGMSIRFVAVYEQLPGLTAGSTPSAIP